MSKKLLTIALMGVVAVQCMGCNITKSTESSSSVKQQEMQETEEQSTDIGNKEETEALDDIPTPVDQIGNN